VLVSLNREFRQHFYYLLFRSFWRRRRWWGRRRGEGRGI